MFLVVRVIDLSAGQNLVDLCMQETGGLGVSCIIDSGGKSSIYSRGKFEKTSQSINLTIEISELYINSLQFMQILSSSQ